MRRKTLIQLVCVIASLVGLAWLLGRIGWATVGSALVRVGWPALAVLMLLGWCESVADAAALWVIMRRRLPLGFVVTVNAAGSMLNLILPWESGEVLKGTLLRERVGTQPAISGTIIWNYVFKISRPALSMAAALCGWALCDGIDRFHVGVILAANALAFLPYFGLWICIRYGAAKGFLRVLDLIPILRRHPERWGEVARQIDREVKLFWHERPAAYLKVFFLQILARMTGWASYVVALQALGAHYSFGQVALAYATLNVAEFVTAVLPARVGVSEGSSFFLFQFIGLDPVLGVIMALMLRVRTIVANGVIAPFAFLRGTPVMPLSDGTPEAPITEKEPRSS
ncbi:MAG: lysylphosphatidylglycerol synthase transmembrane domain-containing protein [Polyangia bacterium]